MSSARPRGRGFTLIELLVVVAIIALLISILLPSLSRAREQARIAKCTANLKSITLAVTGYLLENDYIVFAFPFYYKAQDGAWGNNFNLITEFIWGGAVPDKTSAQWVATGIGGPNPVTSKSDIYWVRPSQRPMNKFFSAEVSWDDIERVGNNTARTNKAMDLPDFFKCPSDKTAAVPLANGQNNDLDGDTAFSTWEFWGTSYASNWYWPYYFYDAQTGKGTKKGKMAPYNSNFGRIVAGGPSTATDGQYPSLAREMLKDKGGRWASEFIIFYENRMNYAMDGARPRGIPNPNAKINFVGWHGALDSHSAGMLDGSARYRKFDTRYVDGPGWTTWPNRPWFDDWAPFADN